MNKEEELEKLILDKHPEWIWQPKRTVSEISHYSTSVCGRVLKILRLIYPKLSGPPGPNGPTTVLASTKTAPTLTQEQILTMDWKDILKLAMFKQIDLDVGVLNFYERQGFFRKELETQEDAKYTYSEPEWLYQHQKDMAKLMRKGNIFAWGPRQETGKSTLALILIYEYLYEFVNSLAINISTGKTLSRGLIGKIRNDPLLWNVWEHETKLPLAESITLYNSSKLMLLPCDPAATQGWTGGILWIDEFDKILQEESKRMALAGALPVVLMPLKAGKGRIWITGNQAVGKGAAQFEFFKRELLRFGNKFPVCSLDMNQEGGYNCNNLNDFNVELTDAFWKEMIYRLQTALADEEFAKAQMLNIYTGESVMFSAELIADAFESWSEESIPEYPLNVVMGIDPGHTHATGVIILARDRKGDVYEVFAKEYFGSQISEEKLKDKIMELYRKYGVRSGHCESNSGGMWWMDHWRLEGLTFWAANFGTANPNTGEVSNMARAFERTYHERVLKHLLEKGQIHLHNQQLFKEFSLYNPVENKVKGKGDLVDALLHATFHIVGGMNYIMEIMQERSEIIEEDVFAL